MSVIEASSAGVKDMADGSLRITFEFDPRHAAEAFALFGPRGRAVAVAALKDGSGAVEPRQEPRAEPAQKGGEWAKLAGMWCNDPDFWGWASGHFAFPVRDAKGAADLMRRHCDINSRAELDNDTSALARFNATIRVPFMNYMKAVGIQK